MQRLRHWWLAAVTLPRLVLHSRQHTLFREMRSFTHRLPATLKAPLPKALTQVTPSDQDLQCADLREHVVRDLADLAALFDRSSPLGLCLRRSLTRYHFLRRAGIPVKVHFGARFVDGKPDREIAGHAWLTLAGEPYHEASENWRGFTSIITWPEEP